MTETETVSRSNLLSVARRAAAGVPPLPDPAWDKEDVTAWICLHLLHQIGTDVGLAVYRARKKYLSHEYAKAERRARKQTGSPFERELVAKPVPVDAKLDAESLLERLDRRLKSVVLRRFWREQMYKQIAQRTGQHRSRPRQLCIEAIQTMRVYAERRM